MQGNGEAAAESWCAPGGGEAADDGVLVLGCGGGGPHPGRRRGARASPRTEAGGGPAALGQSGGGAAHGQDGGGAAPAKAAAAQELR